MQVAIPSSIAPSSDGEPIEPAAFARALERLGPFENQPRLAVAVSGGRDSMALVLLAAEWAAAQGGTVEAVTVDHGLRAESAAEARQVGRWLGRIGIPHHVLTWTPPNSQVGVEAAARVARYELLERFCRDRGILHLLVGHHLADQTETQIMRRARASGPVGLAGMAAVRELAHVRILRPLLHVSRGRVTATLMDRHQAWIEDPSNVDTRFARARLRVVHGDREAARPDIAAGLRRASDDRELARIAARAVDIHPAGWATLDLDTLAAAPPDLVRRLVGNVVSCVGGRFYPPRGSRLARTVARVFDGNLGAGATLGGCVLRPAGPRSVAVLREFAATASPVPVAAGSTHWDDRFAITVPDEVAEDAMLGAAGQFEAAGDVFWDRIPGLSLEIRKTLPVLVQDGKIHQCSLAQAQKRRADVAFARFCPKIPVAGACFATS